MENELSNKQKLTYIYSFISLVAFLWWLSLPPGVFLFYVSVIFCVLVVFTFITPIARPFIWFLNAPAIVIIFYLVLIFLYGMLFSASYLSWKEIFQHGIHEADIAYAEEQKILAKQIIEENNKSAQKEMMDFLRKDSQVAEFVFAARESLKTNNLIHPVRYASDDPTEVIFNSLEDKAFDKAIKKYAEHARDPRGFQSSYHYAMTQEWDSRMDNLHKWFLENDVGPNKFAPVYTLFEPLSGPKWPAVRKSWYWPSWLPPKNGH